MLDLAIGSDTTKASLTGRLDPGLSPQGQAAPESVKSLIQRFYAAVR